MSFLVPLRDCMNSSVSSHDRTVQAEAVHRAHTRASSKGNMRRGSCDHVSLLGGPECSRMEAPMFQSPAISPGPDAPDSIRPAAARISACRPAWPVESS
eukprot:7325392-Pyramimonas_sp.AAC.1